MSNRYSKEHCLCFDPSLFLRKIFFEAVLFFFFFLYCIFFSVDRWLNGRSAVEDWRRSCVCSDSICEQRYYSWLCQFPQPRSPAWHSIPSYHQCSSKSTWCSSSLYILLSLSLFLLSYLFFSWFSFPFCSSLRCLPLSMLFLFALLLLNLPSEWFADLSICFLCIFSECDSLICRIYTIFFPSIMFELRLLERPTELDIS